MTLYEFNALNEDEKALAVWGGVHLTYRTELNYKAIVYQVDGCYVEVFYNVAANKIERFRSFSSLTLLEPYLASININDLLSP